MKTINYNDGALTTQYGYYGYQAFVMGDRDDAPANWGATNFGRLWRIHSYATTPHTVLQDLQYAYDPVGNVTRINDVQNGEDVSFAYDTLDRLTGASGAYTTTYAYDAIGNITSFEGQVYTYTTKPHAVGEAGNNSYGYDANGNMTSRSVDGTNYTLAYDAENRLVEVSGGASATFVYDGDGNRVKGTVNGTTTIYIGDYYEQTGSTVKKYYYAAGQRVAMRENGTLYWLLTDHLGSTAVTADITGTQVAELRYKPWGKDRYTSGTTPTSLRFTGQREEGTIGLYFYKARWYDAALGRFVQADLIVPEPGNSQNLNRYSYVRNNPLKFTDPTGYREICGALGESCDEPLPPEANYPPEVEEALYVLTQTSIGEEVVAFVQSHQITVLILPVDWDFGGNPWGRWIVFPKAFKDLSPTDRAPWLAHEIVHVMQNETRGNLRPTAKDPLVGTIKGTLDRETEAYVVEYAIRWELAAAAGERRAKEQARTNLIELTGNLQAAYEWVRNYRADLYGNWPGGTPTMADRYLTLQELGFSLQVTSLVNQIIWPQYGYPVGFP